MCTELEQPKKCQQPLSFEQLWGMPEVDHKILNSRRVEQSAAPGDQDDDRIQGGSETEPRTYLSKNAEKVSAGSADNSEFRY